MMLILSGIILIAFCTLLGLLVTQYAYSRWQAQKLSENFHLEGPTVKNVTDDFPVIAKTSKAARQTFNQITVSFNKDKNGQKISQAIGNIWTQLQQLGSNLVKFVKYLISLARPVEDTRHEVKVSKDANQSLFGFNSTVPKSRIISDSKNSYHNITSPNSSWLDIESESKNQPSQVFEEYRDEFVEEETEDDSNFATIGFATSSNPKDDSNFVTSSKPKTQTVDYEKEEQKILTRLQESDLKDYAIWLELGDLYGKYEDYSKQRETYSFVLKNGQGKEKNMAMNKLIAMN